MIKLNLSEIPWPQVKEIKVEIEGTEIREFLELICIVCPLGCSLSVVKDNDCFQVKGV